MTILVTGANGYLGRGIVKQLLDDGNEIIATDISVEGVDKRATCVAGNLFEISDPYAFFGRPDCLLHLAWRDGFEHFSDTHILDLPKHVAFLEEMARSQIKKIAVMGSMHEIGFFEGGIDENTPCRPQNFYGIAKNALRETAEIITKKNDVMFQWLRGFYIVSNETNGMSIFSKIAKAAEEGKCEFPFTWGRNQYDFLSYHEFCVQTAAAVEQDDVLGIINICSGYPEKMSDRVERFIKENGFDIKLEYGVFPERPYDSKAVWGNDAKIQSIMANSENKGKKMDK